MKAFIVLLFLLLLISPVKSQDVELPLQRGVVSDFFDVIDKATIAKIETLADDLYRVTSINLAVAVVRSTKGIDPQVFGEKLYKQWDVGQSEEGLDHGVLLLVSVLDREVKIIAGSGVDFLLPPDQKQDMEMGLYPLLGRGKIAEGALLGVAELTNYILVEWPKFQKEGRRIDFQTISKTIFALTAAAVFLTMIYGGTFLTVFATVVGGSIGYFFFDIPGMILGAAMGFLLNVGKVERKLGQAEKELKQLYQEWKMKKEGEKRENKT